MGKVYDALRRAEEQRAQRSSEATAPALPVPAPPAARVAEPAPPAPAPAPAPTPTDGPARTPRLRRLFSRFGRAATAREDAAALNKRRIALLQPESFTAEQFRTLRARLDSLEAEHPLPAVALTSAATGDGKTVAAINLALVTAMGVGRRVLLVDCDLRRPRVASSLGLRPTAGLAEILEGKATTEDAILPVQGTSLHVLGVRDVPVNPSELLSSAGMRELIEKLRTEYDRVILDAPPALGVPDAKVVSDLSDGTILVVRAGETPQGDVQLALEMLDPRKLLGVVLNGADTNPSRYGYSN